jgi:hypothetical protein
MSWAFDLLEYLIKSDNKRYKKNLSKVEEEMFDFLQVIPWCPCTET